MLRFGQHFGGWRKVNVRGTDLTDRTGEPALGAARLLPYRGVWENYRAPLLTAASLLVAFAIWHLLSTFVFNPFLIPPPLVVFRTAIPMLLSGEILVDVTISMTRVMIGFTVGSLAAVVLGVLLGRLRLLHELRHAGRGEGQDHGRVGARDGGPLRGAAEHPSHPSESDDHRCHRAENRAPRRRLDPWCFDLHTRLLVLGKICLPQSCVDQRRPGQAGRGRSRSVCC